MMAMRWSIALCVRCSGISKEGSRDSMKPPVGALNNHPQVELARVMAACLLDVLVQAAFIVATRTIASESSNES